MAWRQTFEATAYSSDWRSCGWEWGLALGPLPLYLPLCYGRRPSGTFAWPLVPQHRKEKAESKAGAYTRPLLSSTWAVSDTKAHP
jgi:hypothetical protein